MLSALWDVYYERISMFNVAAAAGAEVWLMVDYISDGCVMKTTTPCTPCSTAAL